MQEMIMEVFDSSREIAASEGPARPIIQGVGNTVIAAEDAVLTGGTSRLYQFRVRHPWIYGIAAFMLGGGFVAVFTMTTYKNWVYESINLKVALYQVVFGGLGGGIVAVILAFALAGVLGNTFPSMPSAEMTKRRS
jgi:hypothetical protein